MSTHWDHGIAWACTSIDIRLKRMKSALEAADALSAAVKNFKDNPDEAESYYEYLLTAYAAYKKIRGSNDL